MDRRNQPPANFWGDSLTFWCRLWQIQIEQSMRFWGAMAAQTPRPTSAQLAAEAESAKALRGAAKPRKPKRQAASARPAAAKAKTPKTASPKPASTPRNGPVSAPMH